MAFIEKTKQTSPSSDEQYQLVIKANIGEPELECIKTTADKFGIEINNTGDLWSFFKGEHFHKNLLSERLKKPDQSFEQ